MIPDRLRFGDDYELFGETYEDLTDHIQCGLLGFCSCGRPEDCLEYIRVGLSLISEVENRNHEESWGDWYLGHKSRINKHFGSSGSEYFFYYWCDKEKLTEHGGSVPGWLTREGRDFLDLLNEWKREEGNTNEALDGTPTDDV